MFAVADTTKLVADGVISDSQATEIESRARAALVSLGVNSVLCLGIIAASAGLVALLANAFAVALLGLVLLAIGFAVLSKGRLLYRMFGTAATLIGAGMLAGGGTIEMIGSYPHIAGWILAVAGAAVIALSGKYYASDRGGFRFVLGSILLVGLALHLIGIGFLLETAALTTPLASALKALFLLYAAGGTLAAGIGINVRLVSALAILPFAQMLDSGTGYFHAAYVFYSPESTFSILQMALLIGGCLWAMARYPERISRHAQTLAVLAFVVANLCALVGSLWGDIPGNTYWRPSYQEFQDMPEVFLNRWGSDNFMAVFAAYQDAAFEISENTYSVLWAVALALCLYWASHKNLRGLFNATLTFGAIHAYTQMFESFADEPLAYVIGGFAAIPLAWGMWRLNQRFLAQVSSEDSAMSD